jgi:hypothetical protein
MLGRFIDRDYHVGSSRNNHEKERERSDEGEAVHKHEARSAVLQELVSLTIS